MFWLAVILVCVALVCAHALLWVRGRRARQLLAGLPTFPPLPFINNAHQFFKNPYHLLEILDTVSKISDEKMLPFVFWAWHIPFLVLTDPEDLKTISNEVLNKPYIYNFAKNYVGEGIVTAPVPIWKHTSKKLSGSLSTSVVAGYQDMFNALAQQLVGELRKEVGRGPFDVTEYVSQHTLEGICRVVFGKNTTNENVVNADYLRAQNRVIELMVERLMNPFIHSDFIYRLTPSHRETFKCESILNDASRAAFLQRQKEREEMKQKGTLHKPESTKKLFQPYVDILLDLAETDSMFTSKQIIDEMNTIIGTGHDTLVTQFTMIFALIGKMPVIQEQLYSEIKSIFGDSTRPVEREDLSRMTYCEAVINEILRLYPAAPIILRHAEEDVKLNSCTVPAGTICVLSLWGCGRSRRLWGPDAEEFRPERWLQMDHATKARLQAAFAFGRRSCMGKKYAMPFMMTVLAYCFRELVFITEDKDLKLFFKITLKVSEGHLVQVQLR